MQVLDLLFMISIGEIELVGELDCEHGVQKARKEKESIPVSAHSDESEYDVHFSGIRKCISDSSSAERGTPSAYASVTFPVNVPLTLFWSGVPVMRTLEAAEKDRRASYSWLSEFFSR